MACWQDLVRKAVVHHGNVQKLSQFKKGWSDSQLHRQHVATSLFLLFQLASQLILELRKAQLFNRNVLQLLLVPQLRTRSFHHLDHTIQSLHFVSYVYAPYPSYPPSYMPVFLPVVSPPSASYRPPAAAPESPFTLVFITGNISVCASYSNHYPKPAMAPYNVCIRHTEWQTFTPGGTHKSKFAPAYYHVNFPCLQKNWPSFHPVNLVIQPEVFQKLSDTYIHFLCTCIGHYLCMFISRIHFLRAFGCYL